MDKLTQEIVDKEIENLKKQILEHMGTRSLAVAAIYDKAIINGLSVYELEFLPAIRELGYTAPTVSELFDIEFSIKDCTND